MITVESGKLNIPEDERFIGFAGDNTIITKQIVVFHRYVIGSVYTMCLRFDDGAVRSVPLELEQVGSDAVLTWKIEKEDMLSTGIVTAQIKMTDSEGQVQHTTKDYFLVGSSVDTDDQGGEVEHITPYQLERATRAVEEKLPYRDRSGFWHVFDRETGAFIKTDYRDSLQLDDEMSESGLNPVANGTVTAYISQKVDSLRREIYDIESELETV